MTAPALELGTRIRDNKLIDSIFRAGAAGSKDSLRKGLALRAPALFAVHDMFCRVESVIACSAAWQAGRAKSLLLPIVVQNNMSSCCAKGQFVRKGPNKFSFA